MLRTPEFDPQIKLWVFSKQLLTLSFHCQSQNLAFSYLSGLIHLIALPWCVLCRQAIYSDRYCRIPLTKFCAYLSQLNYQIVLFVLSSCCCYTFCCSSFHQILLVRTVYQPSSFPPPTSNPPTSLPFPVHTENLKS